jgi:transcription-repair coupling factor (superfamily II helicase)
MDSDAIDDAFHRFKKGEVDLLLATTIVENGIDIPNANTILIDRADQYGLAALYQLRGRVGRWNKRAYAYFLIPHLDRLPEITRKRLQALAESSGYGGGMKLAMRDLEIRGAGNLLGTKQSGHVASVGLHLYCQLLDKTMRTLQGEIPSRLVETKIEISVDARLPEDYVNHVSLRIEFYHRFGQAYQLEQVDQIFAELNDRFGSAPEPAQWLYRITRIRVFASHHGFTLIKQDRGALLIEKQRPVHPWSRRVACPRFPSPEEMEKRIVTLLKESLGA